MNNMGVVLTMQTRLLALRNAMLCNSSNVPIVYNNKLRVFGVSPVRTVSECIRAHLQIHDIKVPSQLLKLDH